MRTDNLLPTGEQHGHGRPSGPWHPGPCIKHTHDPGTAKPEAPTPPGQLTSHPLHSRTPTAHSPPQTCTPSTTHHPSAPHPQNPPGPSAAHQHRHPVTTHPRPPTFTPHPRPAPHLHVQLPPAHHFPHRTPDPPPAPPKPPEQEMASWLGARGFFSAPGSTRAAAGRYGGGGAGAVAGHLIVERDIRKKHLTNNSKVQMPITYDKEHASRHLTCSR